MEKKMGTAIVQGFRVSGLGFRVKGCHGKEDVN